MDGKSKVRVLEDGRALERRVEGEGEGEEREDEVMMPRGPFRNGREGDVEKRKE